ncbi:MAG TPA: LD-carboxypeptidase [bacterium]|nr:LD-carboxypeptidase [bacterium]
MICPPALKPGDLIRVIAPASHFDRERFDKGIAALQGMGFRVAWRDDLFARQDYLAGDDARRLAELEEAFADPETKGIVCARGGYGTPRLLARLDAAKLARTPKVFVGFSDITALLCALHAAGLICFHGPMVTGWMATDGLNAADRDSFLRTVGEPAPFGLVAEGAALVEGKAEGTLVGGNLAMLCALLGTPHFPNVAGKVLFLEDVGEKPFRLDRMLTQLHLAGVFAKVAGIALGRFSKCDNPQDPAVTADAVIAERVRAAGKPCVTALPFGHDGENRTLPIGVRARVSANADGTGSLEILEAAVS